MTDLIIIGVLGVSIGFVSAHWNAVREVLGIK